MFPCALIALKQVIATYSLGTVNIMFSIWFVAPEVTGEHQIYLHLLELKTEKFPHLLA